MDGNPIDDILTSTEKVLGVTFTPEEREQMKAKYKGDAELAFQDMINSTKKYKNIDFTYKERVDMKSKYKVPLAWVDVMALSENPEMKSNIKNKAGESSAAGYWQVTKDHESDIRKMYGVSHEDFIKDPNIQERYVREKLEPEYDKNLSNFKNIAAAGIQEGRYKDFEDLMVKGKFTDDQIKALNHVLGSTGAAHFLRTGTFLGTNPERKARDVKRTLGEVINIRKIYGVPSFISDQYDFGGVETAKSQPAAGEEKDKVETSKPTTVPYQGAPLAPGRTKTDLISPFLPKNQPEPPRTTGIARQKAKDVSYKKSAKDVTEVAPGLVQTIDWAAGTTKTEVVDPQRYDNYIQTSKAIQQQKEYQQQQLQGGAYTYFPSAVTPDLPTYKLNEQLKELEDVKESIKWDRFIKAALPTFLPFKPSASAIEAQEAERFRRLKEAQDKYAETVENLDPKYLQPVDFNDLYRYEATQSTTKEEAYRKTNFQLKQHKDRLEQVSDYYYSKLQGEEKNLADALKSGEVTQIPQDAVLSPDMKKWVDTSVKAFDQNNILKSVTDKYTGVQEFVANRIGEYKNQNLDDDTIRENIQNDLSLLKGEEPDWTDEIDEAIDIIKENQITGGGVWSALASIGLSTMNKVKTSLSTFAKNFSYDSKISNLTRAEADEIEKEDFNRNLRDILVAPKSSYDFGISRTVVEKGNRKLIIEDGKVVDIRRMDDTKVFMPTKEDIKLAESYDPKVDGKGTKDYSLGSTLFWAGQVVSDMVPMIVAATATRGATIPSALASMSTMYGSYYNEGLQKTGDVRKSLFYANLTAPLIGYVESKIGQVEAKLGRSIGRTISNAEKNTIRNIVTETTEEIAESGIKNYVQGRGLLTRLKDKVLKTPELATDIKNELLEEFSNFGTEAVTGALTGIGSEPITYEELEETFILTTLASGFMSGTRLALDSSNEFNEMLGYAAYRKDKFEEIGNAWVESARTDKERQIRKKDFDAKKAAVSELSDTIDYINENTFEDAKKDELFNLSLNKAKLMYKLSTADSEKTKATLLKRIEDIDKRINDIQPIQAGEVPTSPQENSLQVNLENDLATLSELEIKKNEASSLSDQMAIDIEINDLKQKIKTAEDAIKKEKVKTGEAAAPTAKKAYDFDGTLFDNKTGKLTQLGEDVKKRIEAGEDVVVVTAREEGNIQEIQDALGIGADKIEATGDEKKKAEALQKRGISVQDYFDADKKKLDAIQGGIAESQAAAGITKEQQAELDKVSKRAERIQRTLQEDAEVQEEGDEPLLTAEQKKKLETELQTLNQRKDAIQKQSTAEVPVQPGAQGGPGVGGQVQPEPEVTTGEGQVEAEGQVQLTKEEIDAKKADIEKRRQEDLSKNKVEYGEINLVTRPTGGFAVIVSLPNKNSNTGFLNSTALSQEFKTRQEAIDYVNETIIPVAEQKINAKYDAELAALKQAPQATKTAEPTPTTTTTEKVAQKAGKTPQKANTVQGVELTKKDGTKAAPAEYRKNEKGNWGRVNAKGGVTPVSSPAQVKELEDALASQTKAAAETKKVTPAKTPDALKDVSSTAKALKGKTKGLLTEPTTEQLAKETKDKNVVTFNFDKESDVPNAFKDKISSRGKVNGKKVIRVTLPKSMADYLLAKDDPQAIAEAYHKAKKDGSNPALVEAVENLLGVAPSQPAAEGKDRGETTPTPPMETVLEQIGSTKAKITDQIYRFFTKAAAQNDAEAKEMAKLTFAIWERVGQYFGGKNGTDWIKSKIQSLGRTSAQYAPALGTVRFQVIGEKGAEALDDAQESTIRLSNLERAKIMEIDGLSPSVIRFSTGWEKGSDNKWRYEINPDIKIDFNLFLKLGNKTTNLDSFLNFKELNQAYPNLFRDVNVRVIDGAEIGDATMAAGEAKDGKLYLVINKNKVLDENGQVIDEQQFIQIISHELQHLVSDIEGFPSGGNLKIAERAIREDISKSKGTDRGRELEKLFLDNNTKDDLIFNYYLRLAGEVEARNVEQRINMSPDQRRKTLLQQTEDVAREDQITIVEAFDNLQSQIKNGNIKFQSPTVQAAELAEAAERVANNLIEHVDSLMAKGRKVLAAEKDKAKRKQIQKTLQSLKDTKEQIQKAKKDPKWQVDAYHGTPYVFDKFSTEKIGTGEGAQAFGWGLYFTDLESIAKHYAKVLSNQKSEIGWEDYATISEKKILQNKPSENDFEKIRNKTLIKLKKSIKTDTFYGPKHFENLVTQLESENYNNYKYKAKSKPFRNLYKTTLFQGKKPGEYTLLEWDKEINDPNREKINNQFQKESLPKEVSSSANETIRLLGGKSDFKTYRPNPIASTGENFYENLVRYFLDMGKENPQKEASLFLLRAGIDGIKYPAESIARGTTSDTARGFNYVIFDENDVAINERVQFQQEAAEFRAATIALANNKFIVAALENPNASSFVHEIFHTFEDSLSAAERQTLLDSYNENFGEKETEWTTDVSEWGGRLWEKYFSNGRKLTEAEVKDKATRTKLQEIFDKFTEYLKGIYDGVIQYTNSKGATREVNVSPEVQALFDKIMGIPTATPTPTPAQTAAETKTAQEAVETEQETETEPEVLGASTLSKKFQRYIARILATPGFSPEYVDALMNNAPMKTPAKDADVRKLANDFVDNLKTLEDYEQGFTELIKQYAARFEAIANNYQEANKGSWEVYAMRLIHSRVVDNFSPQDAINITLKTANIATTLGQGLRMYGLVDPGLLHILHFSKHSLTEKQLFEQEAAEGSGVSVQETIDNILEIYDSATAEQKEELKKRIAQEIKDQAKKDSGKQRGSTTKEEPTPNEESKNIKTDLVKYLDSKAKDYLRSFESKAGTGFTSGLDIDALTDYAMYLYYKFAGSVVRAKREFQKKFGEKVTNENWGTILESQKFEDATLDIAQQKLIFAIGKSGIPNEHTGVNTKNMTPSQMIIQSLSRYLLNKNRKPATRKEFEDIIKQKDLDINTLSQLRLDILGGLLSETPEKRAEILNQVDDLLVSLSKDKLDTIASPWVKKTAIRQSIKDNLDNMFLTVDSMIDDLINRRVLTGAVVEEFIQRTGFTQEEATPYVKIIQDNIDEVINKRVEAKINKAISDAYGIDIGKMEDAIKHLTNTIPQLQKTLEDKKKELNDALRAGADKDEVSRLQQEVKTAKEILANNKERFKSIKAKRKKGAAALERRAKGLGKAPTFEAISDIIKNGGLSDENIKGIFAESIGAKNFTHKDADTLRALYKRLDESLFGVDKKEAQEAIAKFVYSLKLDSDKEIFIEMFDSYAYANMLGAFKTTDLALTSGYLTFAFLETLSGGIQVGKDITNLFIPGRSKDFQNTRLILDALFNMRNTQFSWAKFTDVILGREGISLPELSMADDKGKKVVTNINSSITYLDKVRMRRDEAAKKGEKAKAFFLNFMLGHNIASRGLLAADYMVTNTLLPYAVYRNVTAQAMQELKDAGYMSASYADLRKAIERGMGKDKVEQQLKNEGLTPTITTKDGKVVKSEAYKKRKAEILFEFVGNGSNQAMIQSEDQMRRIAFTGRIAGFSGRSVQKINQWFNSISEVGATDGQKNIGALWAASLTRLATSPFAGATFRFIQLVKNSTPFGLLQLNKQNKKGPLDIFFSEYNYYNVYTGEVETIPATVFEKEQRIAMALLPTAVAMTMLASMFDLDDEEDIKISDDSYLFTTSYSPAMKTKIEASGETYEPYSIYEKKGNTYKRVMGYKDYGPLWFLSGIGRLQEKILFDQEAAKMGEKAEGQAKDPLSTWEALGESIRSLMSFSTQGNLSSGAGVVAGIAEAAEGAGDISYPLIKAGQGFVRQMIPFAALQSEADNYYSLLGAAKKEGTNMVTKIADDMILFRPLFNNTDFDILGEDVVKGPYGPPITIATTSAVQGLGHSINGPRYTKYPGARDLITKYSDISPIRDFKFGAMSSSDYKGTTVEPPSDPQVNYDLLRAAQTEKATIMEERYDKLKDLNKLELEKELEKINRDVNSKVKLDYVRSRLLLLYDESTVNALKKPKDINDFMVKEGITLDADGYIGIWNYEEAYFRNDNETPE